MILTSAVDYAGVVDWSRLQFAMTAMYHWLFVPLTMGLAFICAYMHTKYYRTGDEFWKSTAKFWMRLFGINFAIGVATGLILEFQFGTNWSNYSHFVGDIFGAPLAIEGIFAFFMEATFVAVMFFGWNRVSKRFHLASTWLVAIGASLSALWILVANAWMQYPVGTQFDLETARNVMTSFWDVLFSKVAINKFLHSIAAAYVLSSIFVMGVSAWYLLKKRHQRFAKASIKIAAVFGLVSSLAIVVTGDTSSMVIAEVQPMKLAAVEGLYDGKEGADMVVIGLLKPESKIKQGEDPFYFGVRIPKLLSALSFRDANAYVAGINDLIQGNEKYGLISAEEKMERGRFVISELGRYQQAKKDDDKQTLNEILTKFDPSTPQGEEFMTEYFQYMGYGFLSSTDDLKLMVPLLFYSYRFMVGTGFFFVLLFIVALWLIRKKRLETSRVWLYIFLWSIPLVYISGQAGWAVAEVGRQPWTIEGLLPTMAAVSKVDTTSVKVTFWLFVLLFTTLLIAEIMIMLKQIKLGPKKE